MPRENPHHPYQLPDGPAMSDWLNRQKPQPEVGEQPRIWDHIPGGGGSGSSGDSPGYEIPNPTGIVPDNSHRNSPEPTTEKEADRGVFIIESPTVNQKERNRNPSVSSFEHISPDDDGELMEPEAKPITIISGNSIQSGPDFKNPISNGHVNREEE